MDQAAQDGKSQTNTVPTATTPSTLPQTTTDGGNGMKAVESKPGKDTVNAAADDDGQRQELLCDGCGRHDCPGCLPPLDPPRYCPRCGTWLATHVTPAGWIARCRIHGNIG